MAHEENAGKTGQKRVINSEIQGLEAERQTMPEDWGLHSSLLRTNP